MSPRTMGYLLAAAGAILFAGKSIVIKLGYGHGIDPISLLALRMGFSAPIYLLILVGLVWLGRTRPLSLRMRLTIILMGLGGYYIASILDMLGLQYITAGLERLIIYLYPTLVVLLSWALFGRRIGRSEVLAMAMGYLGLACIFALDLQHLGDDVALGSALVFGSALMFSGFILGSGRLIPVVGSMYFTCQAMLASSAGILIHWALVRPASLTGFSADIYWLALLLAVGCTILPSFLIAAGIARIGAERGALIGMLGPIATLAMGSALLDEPVTPGHMAGTVLVLLGVGLLGSGKRAAVPTPVSKEVISPTREGMEPEPAPRNTGPG